MPSNPAEWLLISEQFKERWNFPHCLGSMDGKHIVIQKPIKSGSDFYNYQNDFSIVLFAVVDADYNFTFIDVGTQGRISDGGVFKHTTFFQKLSKEKLNLPDDCPLIGRNTPMPFVFVADDAFPLARRIMKPFSGTYSVGTKERTFNYRLSRARRIVENVFGISSAVFRLLRKPLLLEPEKATTIVVTIAYLHNFLRRNSSARNIYTPPGTFDEENMDGTIIPGTWRQDTAPSTSFLPIRMVARKSAAEAQAIRNEFSSYFLDDWI